MRRRPTLSRVGQVWTYRFLLRAFQGGSICFLILRSERAKGVEAYASDHSYMWHDILRLDSGEVETISEELSSEMGLSWEDQDPTRFNLARLV